METPKKRKREPDPLRVTYDAETRTFDRLFKEHSLEEMRAVIRKKMSLPDTAKLRLYQIRDGKSIDLEDDDDFEAFAALGRISSTATVRVVFGDKTVPSRISADNDAQVPPKARKNKKHADKTHSDPAADSTTSQDGQTSADAHRLAKKRRVSFAEALSSPPVSSIHETSKKRRLSMSDLGESPSSSSVLNPASALPSGAPQTETDVADDSKRKRKKKKKQPSPDTENTQKISDEAKSVSQPELSSQNTPSTEDHGSNDQPTKKSKKRLRAVVDDSERGEPTTSTPEDLISGKQATFDQESEQPPPKKKSKQKKSIENGVHSSTESSNVEVAAATPSQATDGTVLVDTAEHPKKKEKKKKQTLQSEPQQDLVGKSDDISRGAANNEQADATPIPEDLFAYQNLNHHVSSKQKNKRSNKKEKSNDSQESSQVSQPESVAVPPVLASSEGAPAAEKVKKHKKSKQSPEKTVDQASQGSSTPADGSLPPQHRSDASVDKPTKKKSDKKDADGAVESGAHRPQTIDVKEATLAAVQAIMARYTGKKSSANPPSTQPEHTANESQVDPVQTLPTDPTVPQNVPKPTSKPTPPGGTEQLSMGAPAKIIAGSKDTAPESKSEPTASVSRKVKPTSCPYCDTAPYHYRSKCKLFRNAGVKSLETRIQQLEAIPDSGIEDAQKQNVIKELKQEVENKTGRPYIVPSPTPTIPAPASSEPTTSTDTSSIPASRSSSVIPDLRLTQLNGAKEPPLPLPSTDQQSASKSSQSEDEVQLPAAPSSTNKTPSKISTTKSSKEASEGPPKPKPMQVKKLLNTLDTAFSPFLDVRDISSYTDKDLEALIRGPPVSSKDVPSTETSEDEDEQGAEDLVVDEDEDGRKSTKERSRTNYASSEDEEQEEEDLPEDVDKVSAFLEPPRLVSDALGKDTSESSGSKGSSPENFHEGNISFQQMEALGSSLEIDRTGDVAFEKAYAKDVASVSGNSTLTYDKPIDSDNAPPVSSTTQLRQESEESEDAIVEEPTPVQPSEPAVADDEEDPIEEEDPHSSQENVTCILSVATPKNAPTLRTRAQKAGKGGDESSSQPAVVAEGTPLGRSARKKGILTPISELPVPPHPGVRVIKPPLVGSQASSKTPAKTPARGRQRVTVVAEEVRVDETPSTDLPARVIRRSLRSTVTSTSVISTPIQRGANAQLALEPEEEDGTEVPRTRPRTRLQRATSTQPEATPTNPGSKTSKPTSKANGDKTSAKSLTKAPAASNKKQQGFEQPLDREMNAALGTQVAGDTAVGSWMTLPETQGRNSPTMTDANEMTDELLPSSNPFTGSSAAHDDDDVDADVDAGSSQNPLFLHSETQQSLPYSQYPDVTTKEAGSPNNSDEENEVEAVIQSAPISTPRYRGLTELQGVKNFSKPTLRPARFVQKPIHDLYGRSGKDSDSSDGSDSSDSEAEGNKIESHIPESRRAGGQTTSRK